jgi:hypothetical protein
MKSDLKAVKLKIAVIWFVTPRSSQIEFFIFNIFWLESVIIFVPIRSQPLQYRGAQKPQVQVSP